MLGGKHVRVKVAEGFTAPGLAHEIGDAGFAAHKARIESMLAKLESLWGVIVVRVRFKRQEPQPPCAYIDIRLPAYTLPAPFAGRPLDN